MKTVTIPDFLTPQQIKACELLWKTRDQLGGSFAKRVCEQIIKPNMAEIDRKLKQANDPMYLAYCVEYVFMNCG